MKPSVAEPRFTAPGESESLADQVRRRVTWRLLPFLLLLYLVAYIDRTNIGVAKLQMQGDLKFSDAMIGFGAGIFFVGYFLFEIPGTMFVERWSARKWIARILISWGIVASAMGLIGIWKVGGLSVEHQFYTLRFVLGIAEAGFFPGVIVYLSHWFRYQDRGKAKSKFLIGIPLATIVGVPLSRLIMENVTWFGWAGWRWVFILEGLPAVILGFVTLFALTDWPHQAGWLPDHEKKWLQNELDEEREKLKDSSGGWSALRHPQIWLLAFVYFFGTTANYGLTFFLPSITDNMKQLSVFWQTVATTLPYVFTLIAMLFNGRHSDRTGERKWHVAVPQLMLGTGLGLSIIAGDLVGFSIVCLCFAGLGGSSAWPAFWTLPATFLTKSGAAVAVGLINSVGNLGGFLGPYIVGYLRHRTGTYTGALIFLCSSAAVAGTLVLFVRHRGLNPDGAVR